MSAPRLLRDERSVVSEDYPHAVAMQANPSCLEGVGSQSVVANVDWLALTIRFETPPRWDAVADPQEMRLRVLGGTAVWLDRVLVCTQFGDKVATILAHPRNAKLFAPNVGLLEIANEWLYHGWGWRFIIYRIRSVLPFEIVGISRADLCADFNPSPLQQSVIMGFFRDEYYVAGKKSGVDFWSQGQSSAIAAKLAPWTRAIKLPHQQSWGHKTSEVKWKLYYKSRELLEEEDKPYIRDRWAEEGLDIADVWRLEVSIHYPHRLLLHGQPVSYDLFNTEWLSLLRSLYQTRFQVHRNEGHKDKSNDTSIDFLPPLSMGGVDLRCREPLSQSQRFGRITLLRKLVKSLDDEAVLLNDTAREGVLWLVSSIVEEDRLDNYFHAMVDKDIADWIEDTRVDAYSRMQANPSS